MIFLYIFGGIILFFLVLSICPVFVKVYFSDRLKLSVKFLFFSFKLPFEKNSSSTEKEGVAEKENSKLNSNLVNSKFSSIIKERGFLGFLKVIKQLSDILFYSAKKVLKKIHISSFDLYLLVADENAAKTAINYGKVSALIKYVESVLLKNVDKNKYYIEVIPGFNEKECKVDFFSKFYFFPASMLGIALRAVFKFAKSMYFNTISERV